MQLLTPFPLDPGNLRNPGMSSKISKMDVYFYNDLRPLGPSNEHTIFSHFLHFLDSFYDFFDGAYDVFGKLL